MISHLSKEPHPKYFLQSMTQRRGVREGGWLVETTLVLDEARMPMMMEEGKRNVEVETSITVVMPTMKSRVEILM
jgi:hypothetical protein